MAQKILKHDDKRVERVMRRAGYSLLVGVFFAVAPCPGLTPGLPKAYAEANKPRDSGRDHDAANAAAETGGRATSQGHGVEIPAPRKDNTALAKALGALNLISESHPGASAAHEAAIRNARAISNPVARAIAVAEAQAQFASSSERSTNATVDARVSSILGFRRTSASTAKAGANQ